MADVKGTELASLLGRRVVLTERFEGFEFERSGTVVGVLQGLPGSRCGDEFCLDQDDGECAFYALDQVSLVQVI